jgi:hypothetical protein
MKGAYPCFSRRCGSTDLEFKYRGSWVKVRCVSCGCSGPEADEPEDEKQAVELWNEIGCKACRP